MASRKKPRIPKTRRAAKPARAGKNPPVTEKTLGESIIEQMVRHNELLAGIVAAMQQRNGMLSVVTSPAPTMAHATPVVTGLVGRPSGLVTTDVQKAIEHLNITTEAPAVADLPRRKRGRPSKAELALREAQKEGNPVKVEQAEAAPTAGGTDTTRETEAVEEAAFLGKYPARCPCGVLEVLPKHLHGKGCPVHFPAEPEPDNRTAEAAAAEKAAIKGAFVAAAGASSAVRAMAATPEEIKTPIAAPTLDDVRAVAIVYIGKHGKEKLTALLGQFKAEKITALDPAHYPAVLAAIQAGL